MNIRPVDVVLCLQGEREAGCIESDSSAGGRRNTVHCHQRGWVFSSHIIFNICVLTWPSYNKEKLKLKSGTWKLLLKLWCCEWSAADCERVRISLLSPSALSLHFNCAACFWSAWSWADHPGPCGSEKRFENWTNSAIYWRCSGRQNVSGMREKRRNALFTLLVSWLHRQDFKIWFWTNWRLHCMCFLCRMIFSVGTDHEQHPALTKLCWTNKCMSHCLKSTCSCSASRQCF